MCGQVQRLASALGPQLAAAGPLTELLELMSDEHPEVRAAAFASPFAVSKVLMPIVGLASTASKTKATDMVSPMCVSPRATPAQGPLADCVTCLLMPLARPSARQSATHSVRNKIAPAASVGKTLENPASSFTGLSSLVALHFYSLRCWKIALARRRRSAASRTAFVLA